MIDIMEETEKASLKEKSGMQKFETQPTVIKELSGGFDCHEALPSLSDFLAGSLGGIIKKISGKQNLTCCEINAICNCASQIIKVMKLNMKH